MNFLKYLLLRFIYFIKGLFIRDAEANSLLNAPEEEMEPVVEEAEEPIKEEKDGKGQLTARFHISDFSCPTGEKVPRKLYKNARKLADNLDFLSIRLQEPVHIISAYRCKDYNKNVGGRPKSKHLTCEAVDIRVPGYDPQALAKKIDQYIRGGEMDKGGVGVYETFVHYDMRDRNFRWKGYKK